MTSISKIWKQSTSILSNLNNFHSLEVVDRVSETRLQVGENSDWKNLAAKGLTSWQYRDRTKPEERSRYYQISVLSNDFIVHNRQHYILQAFEQFGALYMHNLDDKHPTRPGFESSMPTSQLRATTWTKEPSEAAMCLRWVAIMNTLVCYNKLQCSWCGLTNLSTLILTILITSEIEHGFSMTSPWLLHEVAYRVCDLGKSWSLAMGRLPNGISMYQYCVSYTILVTTFPGYWHARMHGIQLMGQAQQNYVGYIRFVKVLVR